jgi:hypothetical protein
VKPGGWYELRDAPNTRGIIEGVFGNDHVALLLSGDADLITVPYAELNEKWEPMRPEGEAIPYWVRARDIFLAIGDTPYYAEIRATQPGWIAYYLKSWVTGYRFFMIEPWWSFKAEFTPSKPPNAWQRVLHED